MKKRLIIIITILLITVMFVFLIKKIINNKSEFNFDNMNMIAQVVKEKNNGSWYSKTELNIYNDEFGHFYYNITGVSGGGIEGTFKTTGTKSPKKVSKSRLKEEINSMINSEAMKNDTQILCYFNNSYIEPDELMNKIFE